MASPLDPAFADPLPHLSQRRVPQGNLFLSKALNLPFLPEDFSETKIEALMPLFLNEFIFYLLNNLGDSLIPSVYH